MHSPRQSGGERRMHPSTPCSASTECGGRRSIFGMPAVSDDLRRVFFTSADDAPDSGFTESIMVAIRNDFFARQAMSSYWNPLTRYSQLWRRLGPRVQ